MKKRQPTHSPFPLAKPVSVGGFQMTIALKNPPYLNKTVRDFEGMEVYVHIDAPLVLRLTVENTTEQPLQYIMSNYRAGVAGYQVDVRGGPHRHMVGREEKVTPIKELLNTQAPFTLYGAQTYKERRGSILPLAQPPQPTPGVQYYTAYDSFQIYESLPGVPEAHTVNVDMLYDCTLGGLYRISVRHLFPVHQCQHEDDEKWQRYGDAIRHHIPLPGICEPAISNEIDIWVMRDVMERA